ncbi:MAG TPA: hypothetical protein VJQ25_10185 [Nitrospira sp.]|nr:hypothetical protein [Nitrospira sp.]
MKLKYGVNPQGVRPEIWFAIGVAEMCYRNAVRELVVTSLTDSHADRPNSLHNKGLAVDFRTRDIKPQELRAIVNALSNVLEPLGYDVVLEADHLHVEFQPKQNEAWMHSVN